MIKERRKVKGNKGERREGTRNEDRKEYEEKKVFHFPCLFHKLGYMLFQTRNYYCFQGNQSMQTLRMLASVR